MKNRLFDVNVNVNVNVPKEYLCPLVDFDDDDPEPYADIIAHAASQTVESFMQLAKNVLSETETKQIIGVIELCDSAEGSTTALELLYLMFCCAGMKQNAACLQEIISLRCENPNVCASFMEQFFDNPEIDYYLVENWFDEEIAKE